jgi:hypothetical protein
MLVLLMLLSQSQDPRRNKSYYQIKMYECVVFVYELLFCMTLSFSFEIWDVGYLSFFSFEHAFIIG